MTSFMMLTRELAAVSMSSFWSRHVAGHHVSRWACSVSLMVVKLAVLKLWVGCEMAWEISKFNSVMIGRWSVQGGCRMGLMLYEMMGFIGLLECQTLSGLV